MGRGGTRPSRPPPFPNSSHERGSSLRCGGPVLRQANHFFIPVQFRWMEVVSGVLRCIPVQSSARPGRRGSPFRAALRDRTNSATRGIGPPESRSIRPVGSLTRERGRFGSKIAPRKTLSKAAKDCHGLPSSPQGHGTFHPKGAGHGCFEPRSRCDDVVLPHQAGGRAPTE